jgi:hypothetical protein
MNPLSIARKFHYEKHFIVFSTKAICVGFRQLVIFVAFFEKIIFRLLRKLPTLARRARIFQRSILYLSQ